MSAPGDTRVQLADGTTIIPATRRTDGTWRKEIRVRPGYVPLEEAGAYKSPAQRAAEARDGLPVGAAGPGFLDSPDAHARGRGGLHAPVPGQLLQAIQQAAASHGASALPPMRVGGGLPPQSSGTPPPRTLTKPNLEGLSESQKRSVKRGEKRRVEREGAAAERLAERIAEVEAAVARGVGAPDALGTSSGPPKVTLKSSRPVGVAAASSSSGGSGGSAGAAPVTAPAAGVDSAEPVVAVTEARRSLKRAQKALRLTLDLEAQAASAPDLPLNQDQQSKLSKKWELVAQVEELSKQVRELGGRGGGGGEGEGEA